MAPKSWLSIPSDSPFSLANIPFGIISTADDPSPRPAIAIGEFALDLFVFANARGFSGLPEIQPHLSVFSNPTLNAFAALGRPVHKLVREYLQAVFSESTPYAEILQKNVSLHEVTLLPLSRLKTHLPMQIGDYTDFYAGINHAFNVGSLFRDPKTALQPNFKHLPVGYHGRASTVIVSGTPVRRPSGQILENPAAEVRTPIHAPSRHLDFELELAVFLCKGNDLGTPVPLAAAENCIFGAVLMNDWSARDIQTWEYVPLGPFGAKNFATTISPWIVLADALEPFMEGGLENDVKILPYLQEKRCKNVYDIKLRVDLTTKSGHTETITETTSRNLIWSFPQMLAHHSVTGCAMHVGDLLASGTISGLETTERGSLLEQTIGGKSSIKLGNGEKRTFLEDGDTVAMTGVCGVEGSLVGFGMCIGKITPAAKI